MTDESTQTDNTSETQQQTTDDANSSDQTTDDQSTQQTTDDTVIGAPEAYTVFDVPEGVELNDEFIGEFSALAKESNLPQDVAQKFVGLGAKLAKGIGDSTQQTLTEFKDSFAADLAKDTALGGENLDANLAVAQKAIDQFGSKELKTMLDDSGLNKHPELVRFFHAVGQTLAEDTQGDTTTSSGGEKSMAERLYGKADVA